MMMPPDAKQARAVWTPTLPARDYYDVYASWHGSSGYATNAPYTIYHEGGSTTVRVSQHVFGYSGWVYLGTFPMAPGQDHRVELTDDADLPIAADAVRFVPRSTAKLATWTLPVSESGSYRVYAKWPAAPENATDAVYTVTHDGGDTAVTMNQRVNGGQWNLLGTFPLSPGSGAKVTLSDAAGGRVVADAVRFVPDSAVVDSFTWTPAIPEAGTYDLYARWTASSANSAAARYTIVHGGGTDLVTVNQRANGGQWVRLGTYEFEPGAGHQVVLAASADGAVVADAIRLVGQGAAPADIVYIHPDHLGTPQKMTDATQAVVWDRVQDPFGQTVSLTATGPDNPLRFPGQYADAETGLHYNFFRDYDPAMGRYVEPDPIGLLGGLSAYAYVSSQPLSRTDSLGLAGDMKLPGGYTARFDPYPYNIGSGSNANFEFHVWNPAGDEIGIYGPEGWVGKHGRGIPTVPEAVENSLRGMALDQLRRMGVIPEKGRFDIKGKSLGKIMRKFNKVAKCLIPFVFIYDWYEGDFDQAMQKAVEDSLWPLNDPDVMGSNPAY